MEHVHAARVLALVHAMGGHLPPLRPEVLCTVRHPDYADGPCLECSEPACRGNRLEALRDGEGRCTALQLNAPHHKTSDTAAGNAIVVDLPPSMLPVMAPWLWWAREHLLAHTWEGDEQDQPQQLFLDSKGRPFNTTTLGSQWVQIQHQYGAGIVQEAAPLQRLRHGFVGERCGTDAVPGPNNLGASLLMGQTGPKQWAKVSWLCVGR